MKIYKIMMLLIVFTGVIGAIVYFEMRKPEAYKNSSKVISIPIRITTENDGNLYRKYPPAVEIEQPSGFINSDTFKLADFIGKQIILIDFWTYSCINCQRSIPYINAWHEKYKDNGLLIVGIHTPEFDFEKKYSNVLKAVEKFGIKYPVVLDNEYGTWRAYGNRYWPRKYLIDINGSIVYDHIGEGLYDVTEKEIQKALSNRNRKLVLTEKIADTIISKEEINASIPEKTGSPEVYFGSLRNELLRNGTKSKNGGQTFTEPLSVPLNHLYLSGIWNIQSEYAENNSINSKIIFRYKAKNVYMVAGSDQEIKVTILRDGKAVPQSVYGKNLQNDSSSSLIVKDEELYHLISDENVSEHTLEIIINNTGLRAFTLTFG